MLSANDLIRTIKEAAVEAVRENDPADVHYGIIEDADTETGQVNIVRIDDQWTLDTDQIVIPQVYRERTIKKIKIKGNCIAQLHTVLKKNDIAFELDDGCEDDEAMIDATIKDYLKSGDTVVITKEQGGQRYVVNGRLNNG